MSAILDRSITLYDFCTNPHLFRKLDPLNDSWFGWNTIAKALSGLKLTRQENKFFFEVTGGIRYRPNKLPQNLCVIVGRKAAKSTKGSQFGLYEALKFDPAFHKVISGEEPSGLIVCPNFRTSLIDIKFMKGMLEEDEALSDVLIHSKMTEQIAQLTLRNGCYIRLIPVTAVTGRGPSTFFVMLDEAAFFKRRGQFCDSKIFDDIRPGMARFGDYSRYFILTSPGRKDGLVWDYYQKYFGVENDEVLVINAPSKKFNPTLSDEFLRKELERGGESFYKREYMGEFTDAIESAYSEKSVTSCVNRDIDGNGNYRNFGLVDPAGLSPQSVNADTFTAGVMHNERRKEKTVIVVSEIYGWNPNPEAKKRVTNPRIAIKESIDIFRRNKVRQILCDKYKVEWVRQDYVEAGFEVLDAPPKNTLYLDLEPLLNSGMIEYPAEPILIQQLKALERTAGRGEKDRIDHARDDHDDYANIIALAGHMGRLNVTPNVSMSDVRVGGQRTTSHDTLTGSASEYDFSQEMM